MQEHSGLCGGRTFGSSAQLRSLRRSQKGALFEHGICGGTDIEVIGCRALSLGSLNRSHGEFTVGKSYGYLVLDEGEGLFLHVAPW